MENSNKEEIDTLEANLILAKYIGYEKKGTYLYMLPINLIGRLRLPKHVFVGDNVHSFKFDSDWNWSMEVYKKLLGEDTSSLACEYPLLISNKQEFFLALVEVVKYLNNK